MNSLQKIGGLAALIHATAYVIGIVLGFILIFPILDATPDQYMAFVANNQAVVYIWNLITYWGSAITVVIMALALYERLKVGSPALAQTATVFGFIWAALIIGSGNLMLRDVGVVASLHNNTDPTQAATIWMVLQAVENGIVSGNELVGSLWVSLLSLAALRTGGLTRALNYLGVALGVVGIITLISFDMVFVFGLGMIVWSVWVGIVLLRRTPGATA